MVGLRSPRHAPSPDLPITLADPSDDPASAVPSVAVDVDRLVKRYGERTAVDGVSLQVPRARVLALLGPNGAGKTTTIETCIGFRRPDGGKVRVLGLDPVKENPLLRPRIGVMLQNGGVYQAARCREMLRLVASYSAHALDPDALLDRLGLTSVANTPYRRLSGGQQQRLSLAMAIIGRPELVFLDEPTVGLDPQARHETWRIIEALRRDGVTVVLTTHDMEEAQRLADHVVIVDHGRVIARGTCDELVRGDAEREVRFQAPPGLDTSSLIAALPAGDAIHEPTPGTYVVVGSVDPRMVSVVAAWCADHDVLLSGLQVKHRTLEDVFLDLTGRELRA